MENNISGRHRKHQRLSFSSVPGEYYSVNINKKQKISPSTKVWCLKTLMSHRSAFTCSTDSVNSATSAFFGLHSEDTNNIFHTYNINHNFLCQWKISPRKYDRIISRLFGATAEEGGGLCDLHDFPKMCSVFKIILKILHFYI